MSNGKDGSPSIEAPEVPATTADTSQVQSLGSDASGEKTQSMIYAAVGKIKESTGGLLKESKPWNELLDRSAMSRPENITEATNRLRRNVAYFKINYIIIVALTILICFLMNPSSLVVMSLVLLSWIYVFNIRTTPIVIAGRTLNDRDKIMAMSGISFVVIFFLTSVASVLFYAIALSCAVIALHGSMRQPEDLFLDEAQTSTQTSSGGFLGLFKVVQPTGPAAV
eukprot:TRINITY_DN2803_c0_g2_i1.p1 TRINITY_DN2803_c0_g2~~TRINITY_DN2803_c0_g2_i1.p1  ORF type:complete len:225 (-),score=20.91 TRINITY_DN2803_c0_g2_i1:471-1145(-)